jgi:hypothetical protein
MEPDIMISKTRPQENISNLLVKLKVDSIHVLEDSQTMKLLLIFILSQNSKPNSVMEQVLLSKPEITTEPLVSVNLTSMRL